MRRNPDWPSVPILSADGEEESELLNLMADDALSYIQSFRWCPEVVGCHLAFGIGKVFAIYFIEFANAIAESPDDRALWVVTGDVPIAYLVVEESDDPRDAAGRYCELMCEWANAVLSGGDLSEVYPVEAPATAENARDLLTRVDTLTSDIIRRIPR
jgi:hypothetical protein